MGRSITVEKTKPKPDGGYQAGGAQGGQDTTESTTLFIGNLGFETVEDSLREVFEGCGKIKDVRIAKDQDGYV